MTDPDSKPAPLAEPQPQPVNRQGAAADVPAQLMQCQSDEELRYLLDMAGIGYWRLDLRTHAATRTPRHDQIFGYREPLPDWSYEDFLAHVVPEDRQRVDQAYRAGVASKVMNFDCRIQRSDGQVCWIWGHGHVVHNAAGEAVQMSGFVQDITQRKLTEQELVTARERADHASQVKSEFLASMSHEVGTPLNAVLGYAQLLATDPDLSAQQRENAQDIVNGGAVLLRLMTDVLDLSRIESGRMALDMQRVPVIPVVRSSMHLVQAAAQAGEVTLTLAAGNGTGSADDAGVAAAAIAADPVRLQQVLLNLLSNAIKYNRPGGSVTLACSLHLGCLRIVVSDTGAGIAPADQARLFTPFDRLGFAGGPVPGTGIGLVIARRCVEAMGGTLGFSSVVGQGSAFWVEFAIAPAHAERAWILAQANPALMDVSRAHTAAVRPAATQVAPHDAAGLREHAETQQRQWVAQTPQQPLEALTAQANAKLVHELQVHQIELEMQNENLRNSTLQLSAAQAALFDLYEQAPQAYLSVDARGVVQRSNLAAATLLGTTRSALQHRHLSGFIHREHQDVYFLLRKQMAPRGAPQQERELQMQRPDGTPFWVHVIASVLHGDADASMQCIIVDIDAIRRARTIEREALTRHRSVLQTAMDGFWQVDTNGRLLEVNAAYCTMSGYSEPELLSMHVGDLEAVESAAEIAVHIHKLLVQGTGRFESRHRRKDGTVFDVALNAQYRGDDGGRFVVFVQDITERKQNQAALENALKEKESLLHEVHHRVKNNLQVVSSLLRLESRRCTQAQSRDVLDKMQGRIRSMALLHELLYRSGNFASVDLGAYVKAIATAAFRASDPSDPSDGAVRLQVDVVTLPISMDQAIACGLLVNELISNCLKHGFADGRSGAVQVTLQAMPLEGDAAQQAQQPQQPQQPEQPMARLCVSDTGVGLPVDFAQRREHTLGLQLVGDLCGQIGGTLEIGPAEAGGAMFAVNFAAR